MGTVTIEMPDDLIRVHLENPDARLYALVGTPRPDYLNITRDRVVWA
jgi:hypothetical protein